MTNYKVVKGDTLATIAKQFGVSISALVRTNALKGDKKIRAGRTIIIPGEALSGELMDSPSPVGDHAEEHFSLPPLTVTAQREKPEWLQLPRLYWMMAAMVLGILLFNDDE